MVVGQAIIEYNSIAAIGNKLQVPEQTELMAHRRLCRFSRAQRIFNRVSSAKALNVWAKLTVSLGARADALASSTAWR